MPIIISQFEQDLENIIDNFDFFYNESQFQFELALELQKKYPNSKVYLEELTNQFILDNNQIKRWYTDIVVEYKNEKNEKECIAIELKYKTAKYHDNNGIILLEQGATDLGRYDFIWDIYRNESLVNGFNINKENSCIDSGIKKGNSGLKREKIKNSIPLPNTRKFIAGFAIMLTNDHKYWDRPKKLNAIYENFSIHDGTTITGIIDWYSNTGNYSKALIGSSRGRPIELSGGYNIAWQNHKTSLQGTSFKFTIVKIQ